MKTWIGFLINLQFFTVFPMKRQLPMDKEYINKTFHTFPLLGLLLGAIYAAVLYALLEWTPLSPLAAAFILWLLTIFVTGGLHLDGWIDTSDAYFSYRDIPKRLEIMSDPRTGAFGVISVIVLLGSRMLFLYEIIQNIKPWSYSLIIMVPFLGRVAMGFILAKMPLAKNVGLAAFFQAAAGKNSTAGYPVYLAFAGLAILSTNLTSFYSFIVLLVVLFFSMLFLKRKIIKWFGGITGDVNGASVEGVELILWMAIWLLHYFVTD
ncbi:adenosylcobinamide-GDP ribazoletransferase [Bacillus sp. V59.32b]|uniref:adenosylcobinamide-GDP ribazoletransferase n=1 Tax=Bacillus sp. V59.32b TaxID=1758642 RepID=UPI000E3D76DB|nr:adenosylcobinamide-GDP ribazoletransferase [Bacillus sp. V59.32b]RFU67949.1 adenosylcobinamide-GDP ribazoletransferase [Bacillus sp. V59.32b]